MSDTQTENIAMLAEILEEYKSHSTNSGFSREKQALTAAIEALKKPPVSQREAYQRGYHAAELKALNNKSEWVSVNDRMPEGEDHVFVYSPNVPTIQYRIIPASFLRQMSDATHWMQPTPPTEVSK